MNDEDYDEDLPTLDELVKGDGGVFRYFLVCMALSFILGLYVGTGL